jgi:hypothetical protein
MEYVRISYLDRTALTATADETFTSHPMSEYPTSKESIALALSGLSAGTKTRSICLASTTFRRLNSCSRKTGWPKAPLLGLAASLRSKDIKSPTYLLAGDSDDITTKEQVFNAETLIGTPSSAVVKNLAPGGHIGLFMGQRTLAEIWPCIAQWIKAQ